MKIDLYLENILPAIDETTNEKVFVVQFQPTKFTNEELIVLLNTMKEHKITTNMKE